nr:unnamed protein product [Callosobruchus analis]
MRFVLSESIIWTDEWAGYTALQNLGGVSPYTHQISTLISFCGGRSMEPLSPIDLRTWYDKSLRSILFK